MTTTAQLLAALLTRFDALHEACRRTPMHRTTLPVAHAKKAWANGRRIGHQDAIGFLLPPEMEVAIRRAITGVPGSCSRCVDSESVPESGPLPDGCQSCAMPDTLMDAEDSPFRLDANHGPTLDHLSAYLRGVVCEACGDAGCDKCMAEEEALLVHDFNYRDQEISCGAVSGLVAIVDRDRVTCPKCREEMG